MSNIKTILSAALSLSALTTFGFAGTDDGKTTAVVQETQKSAITGDLGVNFVSQYNARGLVYENQGAIAQPYLDLYFRVYEGTGFINVITTQLGLWSSIQRGATAGFGTGISTTRNWYEFDWVPGISVTFAKNFTLTVTYAEYDSPSDAFGTNRNINTILSFNDTDYLGAFALHPHVTVLRELSAPGFTGLEGEAWYYELGIAPSYGLIESKSYPVTLTFPITVGLGDGKFYAGDTFGYVSGGVNATIPLAFIPSKFGSWSANAGYTYYRIGDNAADYTAGGDKNQHVFSGGVGLTF